MSGVWSKIMHIQPSIYKTDRRKKYLSILKPSPVEKDSVLSWSNFGLLLSGPGGLYLGGGRTGWGNHCGGIPIERTAKGKVEKLECRAQDPQRLPKGKVRTPDR